MATFAMSLPIDRHSNWFRMQGIRKRIQPCLGGIMTQSAGLMEGKRGLIMGVANDRSIAWGIAKAAAAQGAELAFTFQGDALKKRVVPLAQSVDSDGLIMECDVTNEASMDGVFDQLKQRWGGLDFLVHAIALRRQGRA